MNQTNGRSQLAIQGQGAATTVKEEFGSSSIEVKSESNLQAAEVEAMVKARCILARSMPRKIDVVRQRVLEECSHVAFAEDAIYKKPTGKEKNIHTGKWEEKVTPGPSVRMAEALMRHMGNMFVDASVVEDTHEKRRIRVTSMDLETNSTTSADLVYVKTVERKSANEREVVSARKNSYGETVFTLQATVDEVVNGANNLAAKMRRNKILELVPSWLVREAWDACDATMMRSDEKDPGAAKKKLVDSFFSVGVNAMDLMDYLGHDLDKTTPKELQDLRAVFAAIKDGETTWRAVMEARTGEVVEKTGPVRPPPPPPPSAQTVDAKAENSAPAPSAPPQSAPVDAGPPVSVDDKVVAGIAAAMSEAELIPFRGMIPKCSPVRRKAIWESWTNKQKELRK